RDFAPARRELPPTGNSVPTNADLMAEVRALRHEIREMRESGTRAAEPATGLVDAQALANELGVSRGWIYQHRDVLGGVRIGNGPKARLRFDIDTARQALGSSAKPIATADGVSRRKHRIRPTTAGSILRNRGDK